MTFVGPALGILLLLVVIALSARQALAAAARPRPLPIRLEDVAEASARALLEAAKDPTLHPAVATEIRTGVLTITGLRTAGRLDQAALLLREIQSVYASRSVDAADSLATKTRALLATLPSPDPGAQLGE